MNLQLDVQTACSEPVPEEEDIRSWIEAAISHRCKEAEVSVRIVDEAEMAALNSQYRSKSGATNILSFPGDLPPGVDIPLLGDIVICASVVEREATEQDKSLAAHWSHMLVHGSLHLLGYDHIENNDAEIMENLETEVLQKLGYPCPYTASVRSDSLHYGRRAE